jgi:tetratricopeptide (TPR) repeat protein
MSVNGHQRHLEEALQSSSTREWLKAARTWKLIARDCPGIIAHAFLGEALAHIGDGAAAWSLYSGLPPAILHHPQFDRIVETVLEAKDYATEAASTPAETREAGRALIEQRRYTDAAAFWEEAFAEQVYGAEPPLWLAETYAALGEYKRALYFIEIAAQGPYAARVQPLRETVQKGLERSKRYRNKGLLQTNHRIVHIVNEAVTEPTPPKMEVLASWCVLTGDWAPFFSAFAEAPELTAEELLSDLPPNQLEALDDHLAARAEPLPIENLSQRRAAAALLKLSRFETVELLYEKSLPR